MRLGSFKNSNRVLGNITSRSSGAADAARLTPALYKYRVFMLPCRILIFLVSLLSIPAFACKYPELSQSDLFEKRDNIFHAVILKTEYVAGDDNDNYKHGYIVATYKKIENFKGNMPEIGTVKDRIYEGGNCSLGIMAGVHYVLMPTADGFVLRPSGTWWHRGYGNIPTVDREKELRMLRDGIK